MGHRLIILAITKTLENVPNRSSIICFSIIFSSGGDDDIFFGGIYPCSSGVYHDIFFACIQLARTNVFALGKPKAKTPFARGTVSIR